MKFLEYTPLSQLNAFLSSVRFGDYLFHGSLEAYSCKLAGIDKKLSKSLEQDFLEAFAQSSPSVQDLSSSPAGPLNVTASRRTLIYLILTLNHSYPDYDFSMLRAHHFSREVSDFSPPLKNSVEQSLADVANAWSQGNESPFFDKLWAAVDEVIGLPESEVYSYRPSEEEGGDPFADTCCIWSFNYFFYNKKQRRVLYFHMRCQRSTEEDEEQDILEDGEDEEDWMGTKRRGRGDEESFFANDMEM